MPERAQGTRWPAESGLAVRGIGPCRPGTSRSWLQEGDDSSGDQGLVRLPADSRLPRDFRLGDGLGRGGTVTTWADMRGRAFHRPSGLPCFVVSSPAAPLPVWRHPGAGRRRVEVMDVSGSSRRRLSGTVLVAKVVRAHFPSGVDQGGFSRLVRCGQRRATSTYGHMEICKIGKKAGRRMEPDRADRRGGRPPGSREANEGSVAPYYRDWGGKPPPFTSSTGTCTNGVCGRAARAVPSVARGIDDCRFSPDEPNSKALNARPLGTRKRNALRRGSAALRRGR